MSTFKINAIAETAALFNSTHDYDLSAALKLTEMVIKHAYHVQLARKEAADPQLMLPIEEVA
jgi:hypothetical protein